MMFVRLFFVMFTPESGEVKFCDEGQIALYRLKNGRAGGGRYGHHFRRPSQRGLHAGQLSLSPGEFTSSPTASLKQTLPPKRCSGR
jgi:hypothetical protein